MNTAKLPAPSVTKIRWSERRGAYQPAALIPTHTAAQARQIVKAAKFLQLPPREREDELIRAIYPPCTAKEAAEAVLCAMGLGRASK